MSVTVQRIISNDYLLILDLLCIYNIIINVLLWISGKSSEDRHTDIRQAEG